VNACGVAGTALFPLSQNPDSSKIYWGIIHSLIGLTIILRGGFKLFERLMTLFIGIVFVAVIFTAIFIQPDWVAIGRGLFPPKIPTGGLGWTLGILGGVGGTVTLLSYGYWIQEERREGFTGLITCRWDLGVAYFMTALFGIAMIIIGSRVEIQGSGVKVAPILAGPPGRFTFLLGFWGAVYSSLLGVWQSAPCLFADFLRLQRKPSGIDGQISDLRKNLTLQILRLGHFLRIIAPVMVNGEKSSIRLCSFRRFFYATALFNSVDFSQQVLTCWEKI